MGAGDYDGAVVGGVYCYHVTESIGAGGDGSSPELAGGSFEVAGVGVAAVVEGGHTSHIGRAIVVVRHCGGVGGGEGDDLAAAHTRPVLIGEDRARPVARSQALRGGRRGQPP